MRIVQVGLGGWGKSWAELASKSAGIELIGVADEDPKARAWASENLGLTEDACYQSLGEALERLDCEAVLAITPPEAHYAVCREALAAQKHVLVEKPLAATLTDAQSLADEAERADRTVIVSQNYRFTPPARTVQSVVNEGTLGKLVSVKATCKRDTRKLFPPGDFRYQMHHPYAWDMAIHHFDLLRMLTGQNVRQIYANSWRVPDSPYKHDPAMVAVIELESGASGDL